MELLAQGDLAEIHVCMGGGGVDGAIHRRGGGNNGEHEMLARAYRNSLALALKMGIKTISFPSISTGAYGYPVEKACRVALRAVVDFLGENAGIEEVRFVLLCYRLSYL